jgi:hypothetical protein
MGSGCTKCCGKVQDWCRDSCGCCPCKCCKTANVHIKAKETIEHKILKKETPYGYGLIHAGKKILNELITLQTKFTLETYVYFFFLKQVFVRQIICTRVLSLKYIHGENPDHRRL